MGSSSARVLARNHRVIAIDRPGHGLADPFDYRDVDFFSHARRFLADALDALDIPRATIIANSMGGLSSIALALDEPARVERLALLGAPAGVKVHVPAQLRSMCWPVVGAAVRALMRRPSREGTRSFWRQICVAHAERLSDEHLDATAASQRHNCPSWFGFAERIFGKGGLRSELVLGPRWERLQLPVLFVWGERDAFGPVAEGQAIAARMKDARVVAVSDAGHLPWLDDPESTLSALRAFL